MTSPQTETVAGLFQIPTEDSIWALRSVPAMRSAVAVWEQEDPWGVSGLLTICVERDGVWHDLSPAAFASLRHGEDSLSVWDADRAVGAVSQHQPGNTVSVDGGNVAVTSVLGALEGVLERAGTE